TASDMRGQGERMARAGPNKRMRFEGEASPGAKVTHSVQRGGIDASIYYGDGVFSSVQSTLLFREDLTPVCSLEYYKRMFGPNASRNPDPARLAECTLINSGTCTLNWKSWLDFVGASHVASAAQSMDFDSCMMTFEAAANGVGFAVANRAYIMDDLRSGKLVAPFSVQQPNVNGWYFVHPTETQLSNPTKLFRSWLIEQAMQTETSVGKLV
ncbi:MAG: LysR family glycine cleavage system transcriptional activator, partial [Alphaproteobacteria bacterium]